MSDEAEPVHLRLVKPDDDLAEAGLEVPQSGVALEHPDTTPVDLERARLASLLEQTRIDLTSGDLHPAALRQRLSEKLPAAPVERSTPKSPADVLAGWRTSGPLIHEPTGFETLDHATGGGPIYGTRWFVMGAPNAGKTNFMVQLAHVYAQRGLMVGVLAVDEEPDDMQTRLAQRIGFERAACEARTPGAISTMERHLSPLPIRFYEEDWTIEAAAEHLAGLARARGMRAALFVDSLQTVTCDAMLERDLAEPQAITRCAKALRRVAKQHGLIAIATSEMGRAAYRSKASREELDPMAAGKWSGAIEYQAKVLIALRSVARHKNIIEVELPKNKHEGEDAATKFYLEINRSNQTLTECEAPPKPTPENEGPAPEEKEKLHESKLEQAAAKLVAELVRRAAKGIEIKGQQELRQLIKGSTEFRKDVIAHALASGLIEGGRGKPFRKRHLSDEDEEGGS